jgi:hypothetical protein
VKPGFPPAAIEDRFPLKKALAGLLGLRAVIGAVLVFTLLPVCLDDHFRVFHAVWWWEHPSFTSSYQWLPGYLYAYGPLVGLTGDTVAAPRILTLALHLAGAALLAADPGERRGARWLAVTWLLCSPLSLVLGTVPLTESLGLLAMVGGTVALRRWNAGGELATLLLAAVCALCSTMLRYELWVFLPLFTWFALGRRPSRMVVTARVLAVLPWFFPVIWTALLWAVEGAPFSYLGLVRDDHLGAGSLGGALASPLAAVIPVQAAIGAVAVLVAAVGAYRRHTPLSWSIWEIYALAALVLLAVFAVLGDIPSQYPERMLLWVIAFAAIPAGRLAGRWLERGSRPRLLAAVGCGGFLLAAGWVYALELPLGIPRGDWEAGLLLRESFACGRLADADHVVIERLLPESTAPFVYANRPRNVHIDALGAGCPPRLLGGVEPFCPLPDWTPAVRLVLVREAATVEALRAAGWSVRDRVGDWTFVLRGPGARPLPLVAAPAIPLGHRGGAAQDLRGGTSRWPRRICAQRGPAPAPALLPGRSRRLARSVNGEAPEQPTARPGGAQEVEE